MIDYEEILKSVHSLVRPELGGLPIVEQANTEKAPKYPFGNYTITSPYLNARNFYSGGNMMEEFEMVISYTWLDINSFSTNSLAQRMVTFLKKMKTRQLLSDKGIAVVRFDGFGSRDNFISIQTERRTGFDLRIRVSHVVDDLYEDIATVNINQGGK